jgi:hypothetical protein
MAVGSSTSIAKFWKAQVISIKNTSLNFWITTKENHILNLILSDFTCLIQSSRATKLPVPFRTSATIYSKPVKPFSLEIVRHVNDLRHCIVKPEASFLRRFEK